MSLIDKDKTVSAIATYLFVNDAIKSPVPMKVADYRVFAETVLKDVPVVDAIPRDYYEKVVSEMAKRNVEAADIVRCKECKRWLNKEYEDVYGWCKHWLRECNADDFCSYGERREP